MRAIEVTCDLHTSAEDAARVFSGATQAIVSGTNHAGDEPGSYRSTLHVDTRHGSLHHEVDVTVTPTEGVGRWTLDIRPVGSERALPSFNGALTVGAADDSARLGVAGHYEPPLGWVGAFGDGVLGRRLVRQSLERFVTEMAERLDAEADRLVPAAGRPAPDAPDLRPAPIAENWLG